jgi:hypothetical protein
MRFLHEGHNFIKRGLLHNRLGIGCHQVPDLACVRTDILGRQAAFPEKELQPARPAPHRSGFSATQKVAFRHDTDQLARGIEDRQAANPVQDHALRRLEYRGIEFYRHYISGHHINGFHCRPPACPDL